MRLSEIKNNKILRLFFFSSIIGFISAIIIHFFSYATEHTYELSESMYDYVREHLIYLFALIPLIFVTALIAGIISKKSIVTRGGGVPFTEGIVRGKLNYKWQYAIIGMIIATLLSTFMGLPLGSEGPSIFVGGAIGYGISNIFRRPSYERRLLATAGACSGLAVAFNTPLSGIIFSVEEAHRRFSPSILLPAMVSVCVSICTKKFLFKDKVYLAAYANIDVTANLHNIISAMIVGIICGLFGCFFNHVQKRKFAPIDRLPCMWKIVVPAFLAIILCLTLPYTMGVGKQIFINIAIISTGVLVLTIIFKFILIVLSSRSGASGGIFIPMMSLGALTGALISHSLTSIGFDNNIMFITLMGACCFFAAAVRAPFTAIVLAFEITGFSLEGIFPMTVAVMAAYFMAELIKTKPLYENMLENIIEKHYKRKEFTLVHSNFNVAKNSFADNMCLRDLLLPDNSLVIEVQRNHRLVVSDGDTMVMNGDILTVEHDDNDEDFLQLSEIFEKHK